MSSIDKLKAAMKLHGDLAMASVIDNARLVSSLRERFALPEGEITDEDVLNSTAGTLGRAFVEIELTTPALKKAVEESRKRMYQSIKKFLHNGITK